MNAQHCPICNEKVEENPRYPNYICQECVTKAVNIEGDKVKFHNTNILGCGVIGQKADGNMYESNICYIKNIKCKASEDRFGGIVIMPFKEKNLFLYIY